MRHFLRVLADLTQDGVAFARRLYAAAIKPSDGPDETFLRDRTNYLLYRALIAIGHAATLTRRLTADPTYRGEPARPTRGPGAAPTGDAYQWSPAPKTTLRRLKARPFAQVFAGRSVGQIVDHIRHNLGQPGWLSPIIDDQLAQSPPPDPTAEPKPRTPLPPFLAMLRRAAPSLIPPLTVAADTS